MAQEAQGETIEYDPGPEAAWNRPTGLGARTDAAALQALLKLSVTPLFVTPPPRTSATAGAPQLFRPAAPAAAPAAIVAGAAECGAGCSISFLIKPLLAAIATRRRFVARESRFASAGFICEDESGSLGCFFAHFSAAATTAAPALDGPAVARRAHHVGQTDFRFMQGWGPARALEALHRRFAQLARRGWFWVISQACVTVVCNGRV